MIVAGARSRKPRIRSSGKRDAAIVERGDALLTDDGLQRNRDVVPYGDRGVAALDGVRIDPGTLCKDRRHPAGRRDLGGGGTFRSFQVRSDISPIPLRVPGGTAA